MALPADAPLHSEEGYGQVMAVGIVLVLLVVVVVVVVSKVR